MAGEIISTTLTASYAVHSGDQLYVARSGQVLMNSGSNDAIFASSIVTGVDIVVDGAVVATQGTLVTPNGINLSSGSAAAADGTSVTIGQDGVVRSLAGSGIRLVGSGSTVVNFGQVTGGVTGVALVGDSTQTRNAGNYTGGRFALDIMGTSASVVNSGTLDGGENAIQLATRSVDIENSGLASGGRVGIFMHGAIAEVRSLILLNTGTISGSIGGVLADDFGTFAAGSLLRIANSGTISGRDAAIETAGDLQLVLANAAGGVVQASAGPAIVATNTLRLTNFGDILGSSGPAIRLEVGADLSQIINHGNIGGYLGSINASAVFAGAAVTVANFGTLSGGYTGAGVADIIRNQGLFGSASTGAGNDVVRNRGVIDTFLVLGADADIYTAAGTGVVDGYVDGGTGTDTLTGGGQADDLRGGTDNDLLEGRDGDDLLSGNHGEDTVAGDRGDDTVQGGEGEDLLAGGQGADTFRFISRAEAGQNAKADSIADFGHLEDVIDVSAFMGGADFIGNNVFSATGREVRYDKATGLMEGDANGDGSADWTLNILNRPTVSAADFVF